MIATSLIVALALTIAIETALAGLILRRFVWLESLLIQCATWPFAQLLLWRTGRFWAIEAGVAVVETLMWRAVLPMSWRRAALVSLFANSATTLLALSLA